MGWMWQKQIFRKFPNLFIVFVTDLIQYAREGYRVHAFRYLLKAELDTELGVVLTISMKKLH